METKKKKGRGPSKPQKPVGAIKYETLEFLGIYKSPHQAASVIFEQSAYGSRIRMCADDEIIKVKGIIFVWVDDSQGLTAETIAEVKKMAAEKKILTPKDMKFTLKMVKKMTQEEFKLLSDLFNKYNDVD